MIEGGITFQHDGLSKPLDAPRLRILSLGAGVQSTTLALMAERGDLPRPDCAIIADTQAEPKRVYRHIEWLVGQLSYPVHIVTAGSLRQEMLDAGAGVAGAYGRPPMFVRNVKTGRIGMTRRQCTQDYKLEPIVAKVRALIGLEKGQSIRHFLKLKRGEPVPALIEQWIGISTDEIQRVRPSGFPYIHNRHPLIEARMSRRDCLTWLRERQYPEPPKSACTFCPFHSNAMWRDLKDNDPESFADAVEVDELIRASGRHKGMRELAFIHRSATPLATADLAAPDAPGFDFGAECLGMCGV